MSVVSTSLNVLYSVRSRIETSSITGGAFSLAFSSAFDVASATSDGIDLQYDVEKQVFNSVSIQYGVRKVVVPSKVFSLKYNVRSTSSRSFSVVYGVRVPISSPKIFAIVYGVRFRTTKSISVQYDTVALGVSSVSKSFSVSYHTLKTPTANEVIATPLIGVDSVPPQIVTTSF